MKHRLDWMILFSLLAATAHAQPPAGPVRFTTARQHEVHARVRLSGNVEAHTETPVASEVAGFVIERLAREGDSVTQGKPLAKLRTRNLELDRKAMLGQLKEAKAELRRAERDLDRARRLREQELLPEEDLDTAEATKLAAEGRIQRIEANVERIELDIERCTIRAPFDGVVVREYTDVGAWINVGSPVVEMVSMDALEVRIDVPQSYYHQMKTGVEVEIHVESTPPLQLTGKVIAIIPRADVRSRVFPIKVLVQDIGSENLVPGMLVTTIVPVGDARTLTLVPKDAILSQGSNRMVYVINDENMAESVQVETGEGYGAWIAVTGVEPGTRVITRGNERIFPGQPVTGEPQEYALP
jgi:RND family efflux transporter MFP subunit